MCLYAGRGRSSSSRSDSLHRSPRRSRGRICRTLQPRTRTQRFPHAPRGHVTSKPSSTNQIRSHAPGSRVFCDRRSRSRPASSPSGRGESPESPDAEWFGSSVARRRRRLRPKVCPRRSRGSPQQRRQLQRRGEDGPCIIYLYFCLGRSFNCF